MIWQYLEKPVRVFVLIMKNYASVSVPRTSYSFTCGDHSLKVVANFTYLGLLLLTEMLDFNIMVKSVAQSAGRELGLLKAKSKSYGDMPYKAFI
jgi:hypothetical protein